MNKEHKWLEISNDISRIAEKIITTEDKEDLKDNFINTIEKTSQLINNIIKKVESTVSDEEIKRETGEIVDNINLEFKNLMTQVKTRFSISSDKEIKFEED